MTPESHRLLPKSEDAEQGVISSILLSPDYAIEHCEIQGLSSNSFHIPAHAIIFAELLLMHSLKKPIDLITLTQALRDAGNLAAVGGAAYVTHLCTFLPTAANVAHYAGIVAEKARMRSVIHVCTEFAGRAYEEAEPEPLIDELEARVMAIAGDGRMSGDNSIAEIPANQGVMDAINAIEEMYNRRGKIGGIATGLPMLDKLTDGWHAGEFVVIGARPSVGKTALLMDFAIHAAIEGKRVAVFSAEMSSGQLFQRAVCTNARVNIRSVRDGLLSEGDFPKLIKSASKLAPSGLVVLDAVGATINAVRARTRRLHRKRPIDLIVVDYLQKLRHPPASKYREREIAEVSEGLKNLARELSVPVITAAQINREGADSAPKLYHLRESGSIEQDADVVLILDRPETRAKTDEDKAALDGHANIEIAKQRNGPLGDIPLTFMKQFTTFEPRAYETQ